MSISLKKQRHKPDRMNFIGGSDARVIMGKDEKALSRLWREKRGEAAAIDLSGVLIVQLGLVTEDLNRRWYELNSGHRIGDVQPRHPPDNPMDGRHAGWAGQGNRRGVRGQVHAAMVVLGRGGC